MSLTNPYVTNGDQESSAQQFLLTAEDFRAIAVRVRQATGIVLGETKRDLVYSRLGRRLRKLGIGCFSDYLNVLDGAAEQGELVNAITTNLTSFFRESHHFDTFERDTIPEMTSAP